MTVALTRTSTSTDFLITQNEYQPSFGQKKMNETLASDKDNTYTSLVPNWKAKQLKCFAFILQHLPQETTVLSLGGQTVPGCPGITVGGRLDFRRRQYEEGSRRTWGLLGTMSPSLRLSPPFFIVLGHLLRSKGTAAAAMRSIKCALSLHSTAVTLPVFLPATPFYLLQVCTPREIQLKYQSFFLSSILFCQY